MDRILSRRIALFIERIFNTRRIFHTMVAETVSNIAFPKPMLVEIGCRKTADPQTGTFDRVTADRRIHRPEIELAQILIFIGLHIAGYKYLYDFFEPIINRYGT